jgi:hypothetical protein
MNNEPGEISMNNQASFDLSIVLLKEGSGWVAQCLEYDIAAQGNTVKKAQQAFEKTFVGQLIVDVKHNKMPLEGIAKAPKMYWDMIDQAEHRQERRPVYLPETFPCLTMATANYLQFQN